MPRIATKGLQWQNAKIGARLLIINKWGVCAQLHALRLFLGKCSVIQCIRHTGQAPTSKSKSEPIIRGQDIL